MANAQGNLRLIKRLRNLAYDGTHFAIKGLAIKKQEWCAGNLDAPAQPQSGLKQRKLLNNNYSIIATI